MYASSQGPSTSGRKLLTTRGLALALVVVAIHESSTLLAQTAGASAAPLEQPASELFGSVKNEVEIGPFISEEHWQRMRASEGFHRANEYWWIKTASSGEVRVRAVFTKDRRQFTLIFVPAHPTPIPEALDASTRVPWKS